MVSIGTTSAQTAHANLINKKMYKTFSEAKNANTAFWNAMNANDRSVLHSPASTINQMAFAWNALDASEKYRKINMSISIDQTLFQLNQIRGKLEQDGIMTLQVASFKAGDLMLGCTTLDKNEQFDFCESRGPIPGNDQIGWEWVVLVDGQVWYSLQCGNPAIKPEKMAKFMGYKPAKKQSQAYSVDPYGNVNIEVNVEVNPTITNTNTVQAPQPAQQTSFGKLVDPADYINRIQYQVAPQYQAPQYQAPHQPVQAVAMQRPRGQWIAPVMSFVGAAAGSLLPLLFNNRRGGGQTSCMYASPAGGPVQFGSIPSSATSYDVPNSAGGSLYDVTNTAGGSLYDVTNMGR